MPMDSLDSLKNTPERGNFNIEDARPKDVEPMTAIVRDSWLELYPNEQYGITREDIEAIDWFEPKGMKKRMTELIEYLKGEIHVWVLKDEKRKVVGFCKATKLSNTMGEIDSMYVSKELHGKGLGKKLMEKALGWLGPNIDIKLKVVVYNSHAIEFYKKFGFQETENKVIYKGPNLPNNKEISRIEMLRLHQD